MSDGPISPAPPVTNTVVFFSTVTPLSHIANPVELYSFAQYQRVGQCFLRVFSQADGPRGSGAPAGGNATGWRHCPRASLFNDVPFLSPYSAGNEHGASRYHGERKGTEPPLPGACCRDRRRGDVGRGGERFSFLN